MHDVGPAADPLDDKYSGSSQRPQLECQALSDFMMLGLPTGRTGDDDLQVTQPVEDRLGVLVGTLECLLDDGPE
jgi:hypothetical protein